MKNPNLIPKPFAQNGQKDEIPSDYKSDLPNQKATWDAGFPQITMMPVTAGGLPPSGRDFNGIFNQISDNIVHLSKGGKYKFSLEYANSIGGYPKGAILQSDDETKEYQSLIDNNKINFNTESAVKINSAWKLVNTNQILDELNKKFDKSDVVQSVGSGISQVMSQKSVTDAMNTRLEKSRNGADIPNKSEFVKNLGLSNTMRWAEEAVPNYREINGKPLSQNIILNADDVGAATPKWVSEGFARGNIAEMVVTGAFPRAILQNNGGDRFALEAEFNNASDNLHLYRRNAGSEKNNYVISFPKKSGTLSTLDDLVAYLASYVTQAEFNSLRDTALRDLRGWWKSGHTGIILQWGYTERKLGESREWVEFPIPFSTDCFGGIATPNMDDRIKGVMSAYFGGSTRWGAWVTIDHVSDVPDDFRAKLFYFAIGY
ncbi:gp53-like domain-containing protein [Xenorhabdus ishibashii]|uniref:Tail protein n=1 Tax=Xenorhabdus ishibashii TaxID=1034471 RepID=A0A2D0KCJ9_9GAMM|nr:hypothetical protein [Xenorhabdus ishibashii]PHM61161.1 tail protein [Xenorhabdus ishibashii]